MINSKHKVSDMNNIIRFTTTLSIVLTGASIILFVNNRQKAALLAHEQDMVKHYRNMAYTAIEESQYWFDEYYKLKERKLEKE